MEKICSNYFVSNSSYHESFCLLLYLNGVFIGKLIDPTNSYFLLVCIENTIP